MNPLHRHTAVSAALLTCALSFALLAPATLDAVDDPASGSQDDEMQQAVPANVTLLGALVRDARSPSKWSVEVQIDNPDDAATDFDAEIVVAEYRGGEMSRMPAPPVARFRHEVRVSLGPKEHKVLRIVVPKKTLTQKGNRLLGRPVVRVAVKGAAEEDDEGVVGWGVARGPTIKVLEVKRLPPLPGDEPEPAPAAEVAVPEDPAAPAAAEAPAAAQAPAGHDALAQALVRQVNRPLAPAN
ncbi:MAG: hypothetical protein ACOYOB_07710 [Myxococcota bacterium]